MNVQITKKRQHKNFKSTLNDEDSESESGDEDDAVNNFVGFTVKISESLESTFEETHVMSTVSQAGTSCVSHFALLDNDELSDEVLLEAKTFIFGKMGR